MVAISFQALFSVATFLLFSSQVSALSLGHDGVNQIIDKRNSKTFSLPYKIVKGLAPNNGTLAPRDESETLPLTNERSYYQAQIYVGSNEQHISVDIDTGSSDLWVPNIETQFGTYDSSSSSTSQRTSHKFQTGYADGSKASGQYYSDTVSFSSDGSNPVKNTIFGVASVSTVQPVFGIGKSNLEASDIISGWEYDNFPVLLQKQGYIDRLAYSVYLNDENANTGNVLFGGIDHAKYDGSLVSLPITDDHRLNIDLQSITIAGTDHGFDDPVSITLDTGSTVSYLNVDLLDSIGSSLNGQRFALPDEPVYYLVSCSDYSGSDFKFNFNGVTISTPADEFLVDSGNGDGLCLLKILGGELNTLGDNFIRHAYIYYDLEGNTISLAQAKYTDETNVVSV